MVGCPAGLACKNQGPGILWMGVGGNSHLVKQASQDLWSHPHSFGNSFMVTQVLSLRAGYWEQTTSHYHRIWDVPQRGMVNGGQRLTGIWRARKLFTDRAVGHLSWTRGASSGLRDMVVRKRHSISKPQQWRLISHREMGATNLWSFGQLWGVGNRVRLREGTPHLSLPPSYSLPTSFVPKEFIEGLLWAKAGPPSPHFLRVGHLAPLCLPPDSSSVGDPSPLCHGWSV